MCVCVCVWGRERKREGERKNRYYCLFLVQHNWVLQFRMDTVPLLLGMWKIIRPFNLQMAESVVCHAKRKQTHIHRNRHTHTHTHIYIYIYINNVAIVRREVETQMSDKDWQTYQAKIAEVEKPPLQDKRFSSLYPWPRPQICQLT